MARFRFELHRSNDEEDQAFGVACSNYNLTTIMDGRSYAQVRDYAVRLMVVPGVYSLRIRKVDSQQWKEFGPVDTRLPKHKRKPEKKTLKPKSRKK